MIGNIPIGYSGGGGGSGDMLKATYDPENKAEQVLTIGDSKVRGFDRSIPATMGVPAYDEATRTFTMSVKSG